MIKKLSFNIFYAIFAVFSVWILTAGMLRAEGNTATNIGLAVFCCIALAIVAFAAAKLPEIPLKAYRIIVPLLFAAYFFALAWFGITTMTVPISDLKVLIEAAEYGLENGDLISYSRYFTVCRNTLGNALFILPNKNIP